LSYTREWKIDVDRDRAAAKIDDDQKMGRLAGLAPDSLRWQRSVITHIL